MTYSVGRKKLNSINQSNILDCILLSLHVKSWVCSDNSPHSRLTISFIPTHNGNPSLLCHGWLRDRKASGL